jgi:hypothetical protein
LVYSNIEDHRWIAKIANIAKIAEIENSKPPPFVLASGAGPEFGRFWQSWQILAIVFSAPPRCDESTERHLK